MGEEVMINTLEDFTKAYKEIVKMGWIYSHRKGDTGVGKTLEDLLGIKENNINGPDFGEWELKTHRLNSKSALTLFTCSPKPRGTIAKLVTKFGYENSEGELILCESLFADKFTNIKTTTHKLKITSLQEGTYIESENGIEGDAYWPVPLLKKKFENKYSKNKFIYVQADVDKTGSVEKFKFTSAYAVEGFDFEKFLNLMNKGKIFVDLRIDRYSKGKNRGKLHDHGTGFHINEINFPFLFSINRAIVF